MFCHYAKCRILFIVMLNVVTLNVIMLSVVAPEEELIQIATICGTKAPERMIVLTRFVECRFKNSKINVSFKK